MYSRILFETAGVPNEYIQYAICLTGFINLVATVLFLPTIGRFSRKKMLVGTMILIIIDLVCLVLFIKFQVRTFSAQGLLKGIDYLYFFFVLKKESCYFVYLSVASVMVLLVLFSAGLGKFSITVLLNELIFKVVK